MIDAVGQSVLGRGTGGSVNVIIGQGEGTPGYQTTFTLTGRCDDLTIQLDFIQKQTLEVLGRTADAGGRVHKLVRDYQ